MIDPKSHLSTNMQSMGSPILSDLVEQENSVTCFKKQNQSEILERLSLKINSSALAGCHVEGNCIPRNSAIHCCPKFGQLPLILNFEISDLRFKI